MRSATRPTHWRLTRAEQEQIEADAQRDREVGMLGAITLIVSPFLVLTVAQVITAVRGL